MGTEIERKFLTRDSSWKEGVSGRRFRQAYLSTDKERTLRVRVVGDQAWLTIKGKTSGVSRLEYEYEIPASDGVELLEKMCHQPVIDKTRYLVEHAGHIWEVDEFHGANQGLVVAEIELESENETFEKPDWLGEEVSGDPRYFNSNLIAHPYKDW